MQINTIACLVLNSPDFKKEEIQGGHITNKKPTNCILKNELDMINVQQNQQQ